MTGLEPAASGVTGRRSNQLSYTPEIPDQQIFGDNHIKGPVTDVTLCSFRSLIRIPMVGADGIEPPTLSV